MDYYEDGPEYEEPWDKESMEFKVQIQNIQEDVFVSAIARDLAGRVSKKMLKKIEDHVEETILSALTARVDQVVNDLVSKGMNSPMQPSDQFSNPKGDPITLTEFIAEKASVYLDEKVNSDGSRSSGGYNDRSKPRIEWVMANVIDAEFKKDVESGVRDIKSEIRNQMKSAAAEWLAKFQAQTVSGIEAAKQLAAKI